MVFPATFPTLPRNYYRFHTDREWGVCTNYHMALDSGLLGEELCAQLIMKAIEDTADQK